MNAVIVIVYHDKVFSLRDPEAKATMPDFVKEIRGCRYIQHLRGARFLEGIRNKGEKTVTYIPEPANIDTTWNDSVAFTSGTLIGLKATYQVPVIDARMDPEVFNVGSLCDIRYHDADGVPNRIMNNLVIKIMPRTGRAWVVTNVQRLRWERDPICMKGFGSHVICVPLGCLRRMPYPNFEYISSCMEENDIECISISDDDDVSVATQDPMAAGSANDKKMGLKVRQEPPVSLGDVNRVARRDPMTVESADDQKRPSAEREDDCVLITRDDAKNELKGLQQPPASLGDVSDVKGRDSMVVEPIEDQKMVRSDPGVVAELIDAQRPLLQLLANNVANDNERLLLESQERMLRCARRLMVSGEARNGDASKDEGKI